MLLSIPWTVNNILCLIAMIILVWMGSMIGYSKILETFQQFQHWRKSNDLSELEKLLEENKEKE